MGAPAREAEIAARRLGCEPLRRVGPFASPCVHTPSMTLHTSRCAWRGLDAARSRKQVNGESVSIGTLIARIASMRVARLLGVLALASALFGASCQSAPQDIQCSNSGSDWFSCGDNCSGGCVCVQGVFDRCVRKCDSDSDCPSGDVCHPASYGQTNLFDSFSAYNPPHCDSPCAGDAWCGAATYCANGRCYPRTGDARTPSTSDAAVGADAEPPDATSTADGSTVDQRD
jgi:hypothetical protein